MIKALEPDDQEGSPSKNLAFPWLFHALLGVGIALCAITTLGYVAANTSNLYCLSCYLTVLLLMFILETVIAACVFMNPKWEKESPSEKLIDFKDFVMVNDEMCNWVACFIFLIQGVCVLLATILRTRETSNEEEIYENEVESSLLWRSRRLYSITPLLGRSARFTFTEDDPNIV